MKRRFFLITSVMLFACICFSVQTFAQYEKAEGKLISGIGISGNYPYIESKIRRYITIRASDVYSASVMEEQIKRIKQFYAREGWLDTKVSIKPQYIPNTDSIYVHIKIKRGFLLRYKNIVVTGNYSLPTSLVASKLNTWIPYKPRRLRESVRRIAHAYRMRGYPLARVRVTDEEKDLENHTIDITVNIDEGPYVKVSFEGNKHLGGKQLLKEITVFSEGAIDTFELEESAKSIEKRYIVRGFPNAKVKFNRRGSKTENILITFKIDEGTPERIRKIEFTGNEEMSSGKIEGSMVSKSLSFLHQGIYDKDVLNDDITRIDNFYHSMGYVGAGALLPQIEKLYNGTQLVINIPVEEGGQLKIRGIYFDGDVPFPIKKLKKVIKSKVGKPLNITIFQSEKLKLDTFYGDNGYPYAEVELSVVEDFETGSADMHFTITSGPLTTFGPISMQGDFITSQKAILRSLSFKPGDPFSYEKIISSKISLRKLDAFSSINIDTPGILENKTVIPVMIKVEEMRPFKLDFDIGFSTDDRLIGGIDFVNRNSFGWGKQTSLRLLGGKRLSRGEIAWIDPKLAGTELEMTTAGWLQYENKAVFSYIQGGGGVSLFRRYHRTSFLVKTNLTRNYLIQGSSTAANAESLRNNTLVNTILSVSFDTRNNFADPTSGAYLNGFTNFYNEIGGNDAHFIKFGTFQGIYYTLGGIFTLANDVRFENIQTFGKNVSVPTNELLLLGGDDTIRGFSRDSLGPVNAAGRPTGGRLRFIANNELRIKLIGNFKWVFFHDMGFLTNAYNQVTTGTLRHSLGFGLHYITPIGPVKADYGFILDRRAGEHVGRFHLTFGYIF